MDNNYMTEPTPPVNRPDITAASDSNIGKKGLKLKGPKNKKQVIIIIVIVVIVLAAAGIAAWLLFFNKPADEPVAPEPTPVKSANEINLSEYEKNLEIRKSGEYILSGDLVGYSVIVRAKDAVTIKLNNVNISAKTTAAIANLSENKLTIEIMDNTKNTLLDGGESEEDGCIYSTGPLVINGKTGVLNITGQQEEGEGIATDANNLTINGGIINIKSADDGLNAGGTGGTITINNGEINIIASGDGIDSNKDAVINGGTVIVSGSSAGGNAAIDTDEGYSINGGTIIAMGTDMLETPQASTTQKTLVIALDEVVENDTAFRLYNTETKKTILSEIASSAFKTLILSSKNITNGTYQIEQKRDGSYVVVTAAKNPTFTVSDTITTVGHLSATPSATGDNPGAAPEPR